MSEEQFKEFLEVAGGDDPWGLGFRKQLKRAEDLDAVVELAKEIGFVISAEEMIERGGLIFLYDHLDLWDIDA
jgi:predicted ribosomally synthesized peptide with nif11-like leader